MHPSRLAATILDEADDHLYPSGTFCWPRGESVRENDDDRRAWLECEDLRDALAHVGTGGDQPGQACAIHPSVDEGSLGRSTTASSENHSGTAETNGLSNLMAVWQPHGGRPTRRDGVKATDLRGISRAFAYELVARDELPVIRLGRRIVVPKVALLEASRWPPKFIPRSVKPDRPTNLQR
jgi:hypothetical protein